MTDIYSRIDAILKERGWSRRQLALKAGIAPGTFSTMFSRKTKKISADTLQKIADTLSVPADVLLGTKSSPALDNYQWYTIEQYIRQLGYKIDGDAAEGYMWLEETATGHTVEIDEVQLADLANSTADFTRFKIQEMFKQGGK